MNEYLQPIGDTFVRQHANGAGPARTPTGSQSSSGAKSLLERIVRSVYEDDAPIKLLVLPSVFALVLVGVYAMVRRLVARVA